MSPLAPLLRSGPRHLSPAVRDGLICLILGLTAFALYTLGRNPEFRGDDDYLYPASFALITDALHDLDFSSVTAFGTSLYQLAGVVACSPRHAPLPALLHAAFYAVCTEIQAPFSLSLLHLPVGVISAASVLLLYGLLRRNLQASPGPCVAGALLLMVSPVFTATSRGLATYFLPFAVFSTLLALLAMEAMNRNDRPRWWMGFALAQVVLSDVIWFVTLPLLLVASVTAGPGWRNSLGRLRSAPVAVPVIMTVALLLLGTWLAHTKGLATPLTILLGEHAPRISHGSPAIRSPVFLAECLSLLMGIMLPLLVPAGLLVWWRAGKPGRPGGLTTFGLCGTLAYGTLFYVLSPERVFVKHCYQIYLLLPLVILIMGLVGLLQQRIPPGRRAAAGLLTVLLFFEGLACVTYIWKVPVSPWSRVFERRSSGTVVRNEGTKAAGYVVRRWLECLWRRDPHTPITLASSRYDMSFAIFSGLNAEEKGWVYVPEFGSDRPLVARIRPTLATELGLVPGEDADRVFLIDAGGRAELIRHPIRSGSPGSAQVLVLVRPPEGSFTPPFPPGELNRENLEARYDRDFNRYTDFFPRRFARSPFGK
ncbi:MAG: hypothetical protein WCI20_04070 [bacterium]